jgi:protein SPT2
VRQYAGKFNSHVYPLAAYTFQDKENTDKHIQISDLLASITGEKQLSTDTQSPTTTSSAQKRKAEDRISGPVSKAPRSSAVTNEHIRLNGNLTRPPPRPEGKNNTLAKPTPAKRIVNTSVKHGVSDRERARPKLPISRTQTPRNTDLKTEPKKKSFAEIMARASAANAARAGLGKITHKTVERGLSTKARKQISAEESRGNPPKAAPPARSARNVTDAVRNRNPGTSRPKERHRQDTGRSEGRPKTTVATSTRQLSPVGDKKVKKAALATTGYTGTARPRPGAVETKPFSSSDRKPPTADRDRSRYHGVLSSRRYDNYDDEMDDFIEYDDEEDGDMGGARRGGYNSLGEDESDMEAGLSDIDLEEKRADFYARREDQEQDALERKLKREKEDRKKRQADELRGRSSGQR